MLHRKILRIVHYDINSRVLVRRNGNGPGRPRADGVAIGEKRLVLPDRYRFLVVQEQRLTDKTACGLSPKSWGKGAAFCPGSGRDNGQCTRPLLMVMVLACGGDQRQAKRGKLGGSARCLEVEGDAALPSSSSSRPHWQRGRRTPHGIGFGTRSCGTRMGR